jgi:predicted  nucleic acid-binding Zn-ribbon protein
MWCIHNSLYSQHYSDGNGGSNDFVTVNRSMVKLTLEQRLDKAEKLLNEQQKQIKALKNGMTRMERAFSVVALRARRGETSARNVTNELSTLRRKLKV